MEESDIIDLEKRYWLLKAQSRTGRFDLETFVPLVSPPIHASLSEGKSVSVTAVCGESKDFFKKNKIVPPRLVPRLR